MIDGVSVVIPAWNEEHRLRPTLEEFLPRLERSGSPFEVIVVTDGSTDGTVNLVKSYQDRGVFALEFSERLGKGGAILKGLAAAHFGRVGFIDADGSLATDDMFRMIKALDNVECVIASRWLPGSVVPARLPRVRRFASRAWNLMVRLGLGMTYRDTQCGAKFFRAYAVKEVIPRVELTNWAFDVALLFHLKRAGFSIREFPVTWRHDDRSKLPLVETMADMFVSLLAMRIANGPITKRLPKRVLNWFRDVALRPSS